MNKDYIYNALKSEGLTDDQITFEKDRTVQTDEGFFSWRLEHGYPYITHFYVDKNKRNHRSALALWKAFKRDVEGHDFIIAEVLPEKEYLNRFCLFLTQGRPHYAEVEGRKYYFIRVAK